MAQRKTINIANAAVLRLLQDMAALKLISFDDAAEDFSEYKQMPPSQDELTRQVNTVYAKLTGNDKKQMQQVSAMAMSTVWETVKNDSW